ncbi:hypothetical protein WOSG25_051020 [Weissella oryzae SG25]|uniref:DUF2255 family protein n=1 Tax=Weissella oryzae (strain DSM 25784 / JCM 18191 / LMG 30913 / SG25) TaxID=1329250 RepID=A0A069CSQ7_WEIOS|nr:DUF2255 family protein [Weissella oryzae]GAK30830.1 hypothetical protein WOSG25_051020 [Weissella oryzae SG25]
MLFDTEIERFSKADDCYVSPYYQDEKTLGTPTWIWSVVVERDIYIRAWNGQNSRWFKSALSQGNGQIQIDGQKYAVNFTYIDASTEQSLIHKIDKAYKAKYQDSVYMPPMIAEGPQNATLRVIIQR